MRWTFLGQLACVLALALPQVATAGGRSDPPTIAVVHEPRVPDHRTALERIEAQHPGRVVAVRPGQPWPSAGRPEIVIALGDAADAEAEFRWPDRPRASLMMWGAPPTQVERARLFASAHPQTSCTAEVLASRTGAPWIVVAAPHDETAADLAQALGGQLIVGDAAAAARGLRDKSLSDGLRIWVRGAEEIAVPEWLEFLGVMARLPRIFVGSDAPGLQRFGVATWVRVDPVATADDALEWVAKLRLRNDKALTRRESACATDQR